MFNEVTTCHLFPNSSFTQVAPFNGALMEPKFNCTACGLPNRIPFPSLKDGVIERHLIFTTFCLGWVSSPMPLSSKLNWSVMPQSCHCRLWTFRGFLQSVNDTISRHSRLLKLRTAELFSQIWTSSPYLRLCQPIPIPLIIRRLRLTRPLELGGSVAWSQALRSTSCLNKWIPFRERLILQITDMRQPSCFESAKWTLSRKTFHHATRGFSSSQAPYGSTTNCLSSFGLGRGGVCSRLHFHLFLFPS